MGGDRLAPRLFSFRLQNQAAAEQKTIGWEMALRIEKILCTVLHETHRQQIEETMKTLEKGPEGLYQSSVNRD